MMTTQPTVAIITSTIGRLELARAIESVKKQTYPCKHYIFVDGEQFAAKAKTIVEQYDDLIVTYLPMNTGANGWVNSSINAIGPYLVKEDIVCYLDDDNWYEPNHIQSIVETFAICPTADFVYSLRNLYDISGNFLCPDDLESLGIWKSKTKEPFEILIDEENKQGVLKTKFHTAEHHIDTNCYGFTHQTALKLSLAWYSGRHNDQHVFHTICQLNLKLMPTKQYTVNYTVDINRYTNLDSLEEAGYTNETIATVKKIIIQEINKQHIARYSGKRPWAEPNISPET